MIFRLDIGGLENGLVNLINGIPAQRYRHAIICIDTYTDFKDRINRDDVEVIAINKKPGTDLSAIWRLYRLFRRLKPDIVHTRNLGALDALLPAFLAGAKRRIHGEHGWNVNDLHGKIKKFRWLRRLHAPLVSEYVALSHDLEKYMIRDVGINPKKIRRIYNGVDLDRFQPNEQERATRVNLNPRFGDDKILIGTVGRIHPVKDQMTLAAAFIELIKRSPELAEIARLVIIGDGEQLSAVGDRLNRSGISELCWLPGRRNDIPAILQCLDIFVQPSLAEGISNTILEAMATGLPVIATDVGGNSELVLNHKTGCIVPPGCPDAMAEAIETYVRDHRRRRDHGAAGRTRAEKVFGLDVMVQNYIQLYEQNLQRR